MLSYNWFKSIIFSIILQLTYQYYHLFLKAKLEILYLKVKKFRQFLRLISSVINSNSINMIDNIIYKNYTYRNDGARRIVLKKLFYIINKNYYTSYCNIVKGIVS